MSGTIGLDSASLTKWITFTSVIVLIMVTNQVDGRSAELITAIKLFTPVQICRATCIRKYVPDDDKAVTCSNINNCAMCFDYCGSLYEKSNRIFEQMCTNITCLKGCQQACAYFKCTEWKRYGFGIRPRGICDSIKRSFQ